MLLSCFLCVCAMALTFVTIGCFFGGFVYILGPRSVILFGLLLWLSCIPLGTAAMYVYVMALDAQHDVIWDKQGTRPIFH